MSNDKPSAELLLIFKTRLPGLYNESADGHWLLSSRKTEIGVKYDRYTIVNALFILHNEILPNADEIVKHVCTKDGCVAPNHHHLVNRNCKSKEDWGDKEFEACEKYLLLRSKECPNPNPVKTIEGNCQIWQGVLKQYGYAQTGFLNWHTYSHILSYAVKIKSVEWSGQVRHLCNNPSCIKQNHLLKGTPADQARDRIANGTSSHGENAPTAKLTEEQVRVIKFKDDSRKQKEIAAQYGVDSCTISGIKNGLSWAWVGETEANNNKYIKSKQKKYEPIPFEQWTAEYKSEYKARLKDNATKVEANPKELGSECWISTYFTNQHGYAHIEAGYTTYAVHILSYVLKTDKVVSEGRQVRHLCIQRRSCCNPDHLTEGTGVDQVQDKKNHGTFLFGETASRATIDENTAQQILNAKGNGKYLWEVAAEYGVSRDVVTQIQTGVRWSHLKRQSDTSMAEDTNNSNKRQHTSIDIAP